MMKKNPVFMIAFMMFMSVKSPLAALNPQDFLGTATQVGHPLVALPLGQELLTTPILENIRFMGDFVRGYKKDGTRDYTADKRLKMNSGQNALWLLVNLLFPSHTGDLQSQFMGNTNLANYLSQEPDLENRVRIIKELLVYAHRQRTGGLIPKEHKKEAIAGRLAEGHGPLMQETLVRIMKAIDGVIQGEQSGPYPAGMPELTVMAFFVRQFDDPHAVTLLVDSLKQSLPPPSEEDLGIVKEIDTLYAQVVHVRSRKLEFLPYVHSPIQHGRMQIYDRATQSFTPAFVPDCVETALRHLINLIAYDPLTRTFKVSPALPPTPDTQALEHFLRVEQQVEHANNGSETIRRLWSKVLGDLNAHGVVGPLGPIEYLHDNKGNLSPNLLNVVRVLNRIVGAPLPKEPLQELDGENKKRWFQSFFENVVHVLHPELATKFVVEVENITKLDDDFYVGNISISRRVGEGFFYEFRIGTAGTHMTTSLDWAVPSLIPLPIGKKGTPLDIKELDNPHMSFSLMLLPFEVPQKHIFFRMLSQPLVADLGNQKKFLSFCQPDEALSKAYEGFIRHCLEDFPWHDPESLFWFRSTKHLPMSKTYKSILDSIPPAPKD